MNTQNTNSEVTIDDLAIMIGKGFKESDSNLNTFKVEVSAMFRQQGDRISGVESGLSSLRSDMENGFAKVHKDIKDIKRDMATKDDITELTGHMNEIHKTVYKEHAPRIRRLENAVQVA